jgi:hypothetical protein
MWLARGINGLLGLGLLGSAAAGGLVAVSFGWALGPVATVSGLLGVIWALSFFHGTIPAREVPEELVRRVREAVEDFTTSGGGQLARCQREHLLVQRQAANGLSFFVG